MENTQKTRTLRNLQIFIALEDVPDVDFMWRGWQIKEFEFMWRKNTPIPKMANFLERTELSVFLLALTLIDKEMIEPRDNWHIW